MEKMIWDYLVRRTHNEFGTAAIMGNLMAESSLNPCCATGKNKTPNYVQDADEGKIDFANDRVAFGLVQWCFHTRKEKLLEYMKRYDLSVGNAQGQLEYMVFEMMSSYKTVWEAILYATDIRTASDIIMTQYEKPATQTEAAKQKRANYGQKFYDKYAQKPEPEKKKTVVATENVRIRAGDGLDFPIVGSMPKGKSYDWVATSNGFHGIRMKDRVGWVSGEFSVVKE